MKKLVLIAFLAVSPAWGQTVSPTTSGGGGGSGNVTEADSNTAGNMMVGAGGTAIQDITSIATPALIPGVLNISGTTAPTMAAGHLIIMGSGGGGLPTLGATNEGFIATLNGGGLLLAGNGSVSDVELLNKSNAAVCSIATGTTNFSCNRVTVTGSTVPVNGIYLPGANTVGISANTTLSQSWTSTGTTIVGSVSAAGGLILFDGSGNMSANSLIVSGTSGPGVASGILYLNGIISAPTFGANGEGAVYLTSAGGLTIQGQGSVSDIQIINKSGSTICVFSTGSNNVQCGRFTVTSSTLGGNEFYLSGANTPGIAANGTLSQSWTSAGTIIAGTITVSGITTDSTHTDATVCEDTTSHQFYFGSGALGVCLGTSSIRFKHDVAELNVGLDAIMKLEPVSYKLNADHGDPDHLLYGFTAEQGGTVLPDLMGRDTEGRPNTFDYLGVVPVLVRAIQQQQAEIEALKRR